MSNTKVNVNTKAVFAIQKHCKVCQDAGYSEKEYTSHFIRETPDPSSRVVCPTLLALDCRYCLKKGHTVSYCPVLKQKNSLAEKEKENEKKKPMKVKSVPKGKPRNVFMCLDSDSEDDNKKAAAPVTSRRIQKPEVTDNFPALACYKPTYSQPVASNYAAALLTTPVIKPIVAPKPVAKIEPKSVPWASEGNPVAVMDWAAMYSDSSDDEDE